MTRIYERKLFLHFTSQDKKFHTVQSYTRPSDCFYRSQDKFLSPSYFYFFFLVAEMRTAYIHCITEVNFCRKTKNYSFSITDSFLSQERFVVLWGLNLLVLDMFSMYLHFFISDCSFYCART